MKKKKSAPFPKGKKRKLSDWLPYVVVAPVALALIALLLSDTGFARRIIPAASSGRLRLSVAEYNYFYHKTLTEYEESFRATFGPDADELLPDFNYSLQSQIYDDATGETWYEYALRMTDSRMEETAKAYSAARDADFALPDSDAEQIEAEIRSVRLIAENSKMSVSKYLSGQYGKGVTEAVYRKMLEYAALGEAYKEHVRLSIDFTAEQLEEYYSANTNKLDTFTYRYVHIAGKKDDAQSLAQAHVRAESFIEDVTSEEDFIAEARELDSGKYALPASTLRRYTGGLLGDTYGVWMRDQSRKYGDMEIIDAVAGTYVMFYIDRSDNDYDTVSYVLITTENDANNPELAERTARETYNKVKDGVYDADALLTLAQQAALVDATDGFFENGPRQNGYEALNEWLFDSGKNPGDYDVIYDEAYGWHFVYYYAEGD
ncbi:MAG: hypothetical protein LBC78_04635, partial [Oscillospiraceae bacterium]|nr:hypothetical protein [Oscillospiraceae bacterium]